MNPASGTSRRALSALVFALLTTAVATVAHWLGSGMIPTPFVLCGAGVVAGAVGWLVLPRQRGTLVVLSSVGLQLGMHVTFAASMAGRGMSAMSLVLCGAHHTGGMTVDLPAAGLPAGHHSTLGLLFSARGIPMLCAHIAAAAISGAWLHVGQRLLDTLALLLGALCAVVLARPPRAGVAVESPLLAATLTTERAPGYLRDRAIGSLGLRGPPAASCC